MSYELEAYLTVRKSLCTAVKPAASHARGGRLNALGGGSHSLPHLSLFIGCSGKNICVVGTYVDRSVRCKVTGSNPEGGDGQFQ
jgi:hypothetical protein